MNLRSSCLFALLCVVLISSTVCSQTIGEIKAYPDGTSVSLEGKIVTSGYGSIYRQIYIEEPDRSAGIQLYFTSTSFTNITEGKIVTVSGKLGTMNDEKVIKFPTITVTGTTDVPNPILLTTKTIGGGGFGLQTGTLGGHGLNSVGMLVRTFGNVSALDTGGTYAEIADGSGRSIRVQTTSLTTKPTLGDFIIVSGVVGTVTTTPGPTVLLKPRRQADLITDLNPVEQLMNMPVPEGKLSIIWIGQSGFILKDSAGNEIVVDPYLSDYDAQNPPNSTWVRMVPVAILPNRVKPGLTLLTHDHTDHTDPWTLNPMQLNSQSVFWGPTSVYDHLGASDIGVPSDRRMALNRGQTATWNGIQITAVYANHTVDSVGYIINMGGKKVYISGDTLYDQTIVNTVAAQHPDVMLVCINGKYGNMSAGEAATMVKACSPQVAIPSHYGMFAVNTENPQTFVDDCSLLGFTGQVIVMNYGGRVIL